MTIKALRSFLSAQDDLGDRLPDQLILALLKVHAGFGKREIERHVPVDILVQTRWVEYRNGRPYLVASAKTRLGIQQKKKNGDPRIDELVKIYRDVIEEAQHFDPMKLHQWGGLAKAAKSLLAEASIHPKLKDKTPDLQMRSLELIVRSMAHTEDKYDLRSFQAQRWHLWAFTKQFFKYVSQMLDVQAEKKERERKVEERTSTGWDKLT